MTARRVSRSLLSLGLLASLTLAGCSSNAEESPADPSPTTPSVSEETPYLPVDDSIELTPEGEQLSLGETATVAYRPPGRKVGVVTLTVRRIERAKIKDLVAFKLDKKAQKSTPYYVRARVRNVGETNLSGTMPPIYVEDGGNRLVQASQFRSRYRPCPSTVLPRGFKPGKAVTGCWVYLVRRGQAQGVSYYPAKGVVPIEWSGKITRAGAKG